jgi:prephenate dehydrogenase
MNLQSKELIGSKVSIIGFGLIGGSIAKSLKKRMPNIEISSLQGDFRDLQQAVQEEFIDILFKTWEELISWSDLIILSTPLSTLSELAMEIGRRCPKEKKLLVIDVGSVKKAVMPAFESATKNNIEFLSTHPMAGKEKWGFSHSDPDLFENCHWIISPHAKNRTESVKIIGEWIEALGAKPVILTPEKHDGQVTLISHLPALISRLLALFVETKDPEALKIAGPGFHSMTRLAKDNPQLQSEIVLLNHEELTHQLTQWLAFVDAIQRRGPAL